MHFTACHGAPGGRQGVPGPLDPPPGGGPRGVTGSKKTLGWGKRVFLSVFHSYIILFTEQNVVFRYFVIMIVQY